MKVIFWIYASVQADAQTYYVIGGYGVRTHPEPPDFPRYVALDLGTVIRTGSGRCEIYGEAREVFQARYFEEIPQIVMQRLADNLAYRLAQALGSQAAMKSELSRQHVNIRTISPEISRAFSN